MFQKGAKIANLVTSGGALILALLLVFSCSPDSEIPIPSNTNTTSRGDGAPAEGDISIALLRNLYTGSPTRITGEYRISGTVVSSDREGNFYKTLVLEDGTGGVELRLDLEDIFLQFWIHSRVAVRCNGLWLHSFGGAAGLSAGVGSDGKTMYLSPAQIATHLQGDNTYFGEITAQKLSIAELAPRHISTFVAFDGVGFAPEEQGKTWADTMGGPDTDAGTPYYTDRYLVDGEGNTLAVHTSRHAKFADKTLPEGSGYVEGVLGYSGGEYHLVLSKHTDAIMATTNSGWE